MNRNTSFDNAISIGPVAESLRSVRDSEFDDFLQLACAIAGTSAACLTLKEYDQLQLKAAKGLPQGFEDAADLYAAVMQEPEMLVVSDLSKDQRFGKHSLVTQEPRFLFYTGMRLDSSDGQSLGVLSIMDRVPRQLNDGQTQSLRALVRQIVRRLELSSGLDSFDWASKLLENCPAAIFCADYQARKGTIVEWNAAAEKLWDLKKKDVLGKTAFELFPRDQAELFRESDLPILRSETMISSLQQTWETPPGRKEVRIWKVPVHDSSGQPRFVLGIALDITAQVELEEQLKEARMKAEDAANTLDLALGGAALGVWDWNLRSNEVKFDRRWCEMLGLSVDHVPMHIRTWEERVHPDDLQRCYQDIESYLKGRTDRYENVHRMQHANGEWVYILDKGRFSAWDEAGNPIRFTGTHLDITHIEKSKIALQESRKRLEEAEVAGKFGSWKLNLLTGESFWSKGHNLIFDFDPEHAVPSFDSFLSCLDPDEHARLRAFYQNLTEGKIADFETDYRVRTKSGELRYVKALGHVQFDADQKPVSVLGTVQDITSLKILEKSLIETREQALAASRTKSRFLANMSHEIRTPLNGIMGNTTLLMDTPLSPEQKSMLETIRSSGDALLALIDGILDLSKIEAGKLEVVNEAFDLRAILDEAMRIVAAAAAEKQNNLELVLDPEVPSRIISDPFRFRQILLNLFSNAIKFTEHGKIKIDVHHIPAADAKVQIFVSVKDSGIGMTPEQQKKIFQEFEQLDGSTTRKYGGTGLGLAISKQLCALLGGNIQVTSEQGLGSQFTFHITAEMAQDLKVDPPALMHQTGPLNPGKARNLHVLIAEDNKVNQTIALQFLRKLNISADVVDNGQRAWELVSSGFYQLVFMDVHMPVMDGFDATRQIRQALPPERQPYIVALTANAMRGDKDLCLAAGMDDFLKKPLVLTDLANSIYCVLHQDTIKPEPAFNYERALEQLAGDEDLLKRLALLFITECSTQAAQLHASLGRQDYRALRATSHTLKGSSVYFSIKLHKLTEAMEEAAQKESKLQSEELMKALDAEIVQLLWELRRIFSSL
jgi:PAS domain S-box-containing protein